jgi:hypothetical protein
MREEEKWDGSSRAFISLQHSKHSNKKDLSLFLFLCTLLWQLDAWCLNAWCLMGQDAEAAAKAVEAAQKRAEDIAAGRVRMNGRELYQKEPWVFDDSRFE